MEKIGENYLSAQENKEWKHLITADENINLEEALNEKIKECDSKLDNLFAVCESKMQEREATLSLLKVQSNIDIRNGFDDVDLIYDEVIDKYRYRLYNQNDLSIDVDLDLEQLIPFGDLIVKVMNKIESMDYDDVPQIKGYETIQIESDSILNNLLFSKDDIINTDNLQEIFKYDLQQYTLDSQANPVLRKIYYTLLQAKKFRAKVEADLDLELNK